jgi:hypothetical protein
VPASGNATSVTEVLAASKMPSVKVLKIVVSPKKIHLTSAIINAMKKNAINTIFNAMPGPPWRKFDKSVK